MFRLRLKDVIKINLKEVEWECVNWIDLARIQERKIWKYAVREIPCLKSNVYWTVHHCNS